MPHSINVEIKVRKGDDIERVIKRFTKKVKQEKIIDDVIDRRQFIKKSRRTFLKNKKARFRQKQQGR